MQFPESWLREFCNPPLTTEQLADVLTMGGFEVEEVRPVAPPFTQIVVGEIKQAEQHPNADRLRVCHVDVGQGALLTIVCGAPNARAGLVGVFGPPGAHVPGLDVVLKVAAIRGVESNGMMCSTRELQLGDDHDGIIELPADAPVGQGFAAWAGLDDPVFDVAITPNRQDCMGVYGIARDLAAAGLGVLKAPVAPVLAESGPVLVPVRTEDAEGCPAFYARSVSGVANGPSPKWLQDLLTKAGLRPISALVDVTNYFAIGHGRPLHVYDVAKLQGGLVARRARAGEELVALNGKTYTLADSMTVIADDAHVHDIGGIMGGMESGVSETTTDVLIEAAWFDPARIGETGRALGLTSDARARFERGVDPAFVEPGLDLAAAMVLDLCGGTVSAIAKAGEAPIVAKTVPFDPARTLVLGGLDVPADEQKAILERLGFGVSGDVPWAVSVPSWRRDVDGPADLVEEVVRLHGLDKVQSVPLPRVEGVALPTATPGQKLERKCKRLMAARGLDEAITWSFIAESEAAKFGGFHWKLDNPLSAELAVMRASLLPGLVALAGWLAGTGLHAWVVQRELADPVSYVSLWLADAGEPPEVAAVRGGQWLDWFAEEGVRAIGMGLITVRRPAGGEQPEQILEEITGADEAPTGTEVAAFLARRAYLRDTGDDALLAASLSTAPVLLEQHSLPGPDGWQQIGAAVRRPGGPGAVIGVDDVLTALLAGCRGEVPLGTLIELLAAHHGVAADALAAAALPEIRAAIGRGILYQAG